MAAGCCDDDAGGSRWDVFAGLLAVETGITQALAAYDAAAWKALLVAFLSMAVSGGLAYLGWKSIRTPGVWQKSKNPALLAYRKPKPSKLTA